MSNQLQLAHVFALVGALVDKKAGSYYNASINLQSGDVQTQGKWEEIPNQTGEIGSIIASEDYLEATFNVLPEGATRTLTAKGAALPARLTAFDASGFGSDFSTTPIPIGPFTESGINTKTGGGISVATDTQPWIFMSGRLNFTSSEKWTATWTMRRYKLVTDGSTPGA